MNKNNLYWNKRLNNYNWKFKNIKIIIKCLNKLCRHKNQNYKIMKLLLN